VAFELPAGDCLLVVGPSGSGKSTLALAIGGLVGGEIPAEVTGQLELDGRAVGGLVRADVAARVGLVFQDPESQLVMDRVEDEVAFGLENRAWAPAAMRGRVDEALASGGLTGLERARPARLSGGQQQRLALAGVLAPQPGLLVLDEPTAFLDPAGTAEFFDRLAAVRAAGGTTIVLVEHRVDRAWPLADLVLALDGEGRPIDVGPPAEVLARSGDRIEASGTWLPGDRAAGRAPDGRPAREADTGDRAGGRAPFVQAFHAGFEYEPGRRVVRDVDLVLEAGERVALVGANGSGKSTLGRLLVGLLRPKQGSIRIDGADPARLPAAELARRAGYLFQDPERQLLARTIGEEVRLGLDPGAWPAADALMDRLGLPLERFGDRSPYRLSGGEQRRLSLATVLVRRPRLLVLDEPTFGQDRRGHEALLAILDEHLERGTCLVAATHDERLVADLGGRRIEMADGWILADSAWPAGHQPLR
jgi:energy-coupling factor transport system ATP-binding protein